MVADVFLDEQFVGSVESFRPFIKQLRSQRRSGVISSEVSIAFNSEFSEVHIDTSRGRARRPLLVVEGGKLKLVQKHIDGLLAGTLRWESLVKEGVVEYLDALEEEDSYICLDTSDLSPQHTHLEITPVALLGLCTSLIPYANFGGSSRLIRGSKIQKQSLGLYAANYLLRMDTDVNVLHYPQRPITKSFMHDVYDYDRHPCGMNVTIAVLSYEGYNMDDAIVLNKGSVQRGLGRSTFFRPYSAEEKRYQGGLVDEIVIPDREVKGYRLEKDYRLLEDDGIIYLGAKVNEGDVLIGRVSPPRFLGEFEEFSLAANIRRESSVTAKHGSLGVVDLTLFTESEEGNRLVQIRVRESRIPEVGDKFASRHGQKGIVSILVPHEDMPFSASGIVPDILFSPHGIPSRMTISHLIEIVAGKAGALQGSYIDGTIFDSAPEKSLRKMLHEAGFRENGVETLYNGVTGQQYTARIFTGNTYYLRLKHMVANKLHARATGKIQLLTRQPIEGRSEGGGLRLGEMEKDCLVAHGASLLLKERFDSDKVVIPICEQSGLMGFYDARKNRAVSPVYGDTAKMSDVEISYAFKLLLDELCSLGIYPKLYLERKF